MEKITKDQLTLFAEDSPANPSLLQVSNLERQMTVTSGLKCYESSKNRLPLGSLAKTFLGSSGWHSTMCALTWKVKVTESNRLLFRLVPSKPTTAETDAGLWPTPRASEYKDCGPVGSKSHTHMDRRSYLCAKAKDSDRPTGKLSPMWTEWLMGFPIGWTELSPSETQ